MVDALMSLPMARRVEFDHCWSDGTNIGHSPEKFGFSRPVSQGHSKSSNVTRIEGVIISPILLVINRNNGPFSYVSNIIGEICRKRQIIHTHCIYAPVEVVFT